MKKILITEDDPLMAEIYRDNFDAEGFCTEIATDGLIAMQRLKQNPPDLVLLDLMLPKFNGVEVLKFIRSQESTRTVPVIVMSNAYATELGEQASHAGATKLLAKNSCGPRKLLEEVRSTLAEASQTVTAAIAASPAPAMPEKSPAAAVIPTLVATCPTIPTFAVPPSAAVDCGPSTQPVIAVPPRESITVTAPAPAVATHAVTIPSRKVNRHQDVLDTMPQRLTEISALLAAFSTSDNVSRPGILLELHRMMHGLAGSAAFANLRYVAQLAFATETLIKELHGKPQKINPSSLRTLSQAIDLFDSLVARAAEHEDEAMPTPLIMVLDDEPVSRETANTALEQAHLRAVSIGEPELALKILEENRFDLIFLDAHMGGRNGFTICHQIHATPANPTTPVIFLTASGAFEVRAQSAGLINSDFIAKPVLLIELAVKALTHLFRSK